MHTPDICPCVCAASIPFHLDLNHRYMITNRQMSPWITIGMPLIPWWVSGKKKKNLPANVRDAEDTSLIHGSRKLATHSNILAWEIPWTEEPGGLQFIGLQKARCDLVTEQQHPTLQCIRAEYIQSETLQKEVRSREHPAKSLQLCPTLCDPWDSSPPGSPVPGILQARTLKWVAISFSNAWKWKVKGKSLSRVRLWATP